MTLEIAAFTRRGAALCQKLLEELPWACRGYAPAPYDEGPLQPLEVPIAQWAGERFHRDHVLVFIGAAGIAVRAIAPHIKTKDQDPAVLCMDEAGRFVIPILSGHIGGGNRWALELADHTGAQPVITTATDLNGLFSVDAWAAQNGYTVADTGMIKHIAGALLEGEEVGLASDFPIVSPLPGGFVGKGEGERGVVISLGKKAPYRHSLWLIPRCVTVGIGCRRGADPADLEGQFLEFLEENALPLVAVRALCSIDLKAGEPALVALSRRYGLPFLTYSAESLAGVPGEFSSSPFVEEVTGVDNVCERAAVCGGGSLLVPKTKGRGATFAAGIDAWTVDFSAQ